jgi:putative ABC transport system substrate-binding protein
MDRRTFLAGTGAVLLAAPLAATGQQAGRVYRIGVLVQGGPTTTAMRTQSDFVTRLRELGWVEGRNVAFEDRRAIALGQLSSFAAELVRLKVDVIFASGTLATRAAKQATPSIPIVMLVGVDPVSDNLIASLPRPGGNITGLTGLSTELIAKRLGLIKEVIPRISRVAYMWNPTNPGNVSASKEFTRVAATLGLKGQLLPVRGADEFDSAFASMMKKSAGALVVGADGMLVAHRAQLAELAARHRIPAMYSFRAHAEAGGLMVYSADWAALNRGAAVYVDKILKGAKPADLPVEQPSKFELVINLKAAKALGLSIPQSVLLRADEVIQ